MRLKTESAALIDGELSQSIVRAEGHKCDLSLLVGLLPLFDLSATEGGDLNQRAVLRRHRGREAVADEDGLGAGAQALAWLNANGN
jgi:hypothetical protein